jgi:HAD superfamily 5'-nucleotidase-like hydrolase
MSDDGDSGDAGAGELPPAARRIYCNRTLNLRSIRAIGFDMDYTLIHYHTEEWERRAYAHVRQRLLERGWPVHDLEFDPELIKLGLILDLELGNIVKANRFGFIKRACHGTRMLDFDEQRKIYSRERVDLGASRWVFMNTLFALSEACMYAQTVDLLDAGQLGQGLGYRDLYKVVRSSIDETHMEGTLKSEIVEQPERFVELDRDAALALLDLREAGKKLMLITNSEWAYTRAMMRYAFDRFLPGEMTWRDLFDLVIVQARKPSFFTHENAVFEMVDEQKGWLRPFVGGFEEHGVYVGGHAGLVERSLGLEGDEILYIGDHIFADVHMSNRLLRWRTCLVAQDLERELEALEAFKPKQLELTRKMERKERLEHRFSRQRIQLQRLEKGYGDPPDASANELRRAMQELRDELVALDAEIAPLAQEAGELSNRRWGLLLRTGNDKSHLARQVERYADIYTSRVGNFLAQTPFVYLRSPRGSMPHDSGPAGGA